MGLRILAMALFLVTGSDIAAAQIVPDNPPPPQVADPAWSHLRNITPGQPIVITLVDERTVHCRFASVTDAYLFCNPAGNPPGVGFRFDHADVIGVDLDLLKRQTLAQAAPREHNYHPAWISSMIAGGIIVGLVTARNTDAGNAARAGIIGAGIVGAIGAPMAFLPHSQGAMPSAAAPPVFGARFTLPVRFLFRK